MKSHILKANIFAFFLLILVAVFLMLSASPKQENVWPTAAKLRRNFWQSGKLLWVYGTADTAVAQFYRRYGEELAHRLPWFEVTVAPDTSVTPEEASSLPLVLVGSWHNNVLLSAFREKLPVRLNDGSLHVEAIGALEAGDVFELHNFPNPVSLKLPLRLLTAIDDRQVVDHLSQGTGLPFGVADFTVYRDGQAVALGYFRQKSTGPWRADRTRLRSYTIADGLQLDTEHYRFRYHGSSLTLAELEALARKQEQRFAHFMSTLELSPRADFETIELHLYEHPEDKGLVTGNTDLAHVDFRGRRIYALHNNDLTGLDFFADARLLLHEYFGEADSNMLRDGMAMALTHDWGRRGFRYWAGRFQRANAVILLTELANNDKYSRESYLFARPLVGVLVEALAKRFGWRRITNIYAATSGNWASFLAACKMTESEVDKAWHSKLASLAENQPDKIDRPSYRPVFQKGFCYAHEGYQIHNGYLSRSSDAALQRLRELGTEWISITPFGYLDHRDQPGYFHFSFGARAENDESIVTALAHARDRGMRGMLKPHILLNSRDFGWPGEVEMRNAADWERFFMHYKRWVLHYAVLAEMYRFEAFCIGTELMHATTPEHEAAWRDIIASTRQIYHGPITYAANWWQEFDQIDFWDSLDYIGLNCYYPLSENPDADFQALKAGAELVRDKIAVVSQRYSKPVIFAEVGFTSTPAAWIQPHQRRRNVTVALEDQALAYRVIFETFWQEPWFYGMYWWKWPTYLEDGGKNHTGFTPNGKPAEKVVGEWFKHRSVPNNKQRYHADAHPTGR